jgi:hypothetical protein
MKFIIFAIVLVCIANAAIYEARNSDDVDFFLEHNPDENGALLFYNKADADKKEVKIVTDEVLSIFKNVGEEGRSTEEWVNKNNDKIHLMLIDASNIDIARIVKDFKVGQTPLIVLLDNSKTLMQEIVDKETFDHIKEIYVEKQNKVGAAKNLAADKGSVTPSSVFPDADYTHKVDSNAIASDEAAQKAQNAAKDAQKSAKEANKSLEDTKKAFEQHNTLDRLRKEAEEAKKLAEDAKKELDETKKMIADHLANDAKDKKKDQTNSKQDTKKKDQTSSQKGGQPDYTKVEPPPGYTVDYVPVLKPIVQDNKSSGYSILKQPSSAPNYAPSSTPRYSTSSAPRYAQNYAPSYVPNYGPSNTGTNSRRRLN